MGDMINVLFYVGKLKTNSEGLSPVYLRVTVNGQRFDISTSQFVDVAKWSQVGGRAMGSAKEVKELNF